MFGWLHSTLDYIEEKVSSAYKKISFWKETEAGEAEFFDEKDEKSGQSPEDMFSGAHLVEIESKIDEKLGEVEAEIIGDIEAEAELSPYEVEALQEQMRLDLEAQVADIFIEPEIEKGPDDGLSFLDDEPPDPDSIEPDLPAMKPGDVENIFGLDEYRKELNNE